jgi:hypothetical protein
LTAALPRTLPLKQTQLFDIQKCLSTILVALIFVSCNEKTHHASGSHQFDTLLLKINLYPAFEEHSETTLIHLDSLSTIQILLKNNMAVDHAQDTFWFKKMHLSKQQFEELKSTLVQICQQKNVKRDYEFKSFDGMTLSSTLIHKGDTNNIFLRNPNKTRDSVGYMFSKSIFTILQNTFHDPSITEYFEDMEEYIDESKTHKASAKREIDRLRMRKYNWSIRQPD